MRSDSSKKRATRTTSNVFNMFTKNQISEFKEAFQFIDSNKDGIICKNDIRATFDALGRMVSESDLNSMVAEAPGPVNFTMFLSIFGERIAGTDGEEVIKSAFNTFDLNATGKVEESVLRRALTTWGEKLNDEELDEALAEAPVDNRGNIDINRFVKIICGQSEDE
ncbi:myosin regulatory light polypeptide 9-like protein [Leptotrombidium deliense]|uniref:Myosin regulatory light polypeptide 9-like protein n=1 Tax=Leptotrombidium deliense TaxID=299467 RepID=A0A443SWV8_9ACAR|nr:myosin regulatory light polypeptide 9-like protein [Leptotrombidium deliense]